MVSASLLIVASIKSDNASVGYRIVDVNTRQFRDINIRNLEEGVKMVSSKFINVKSSLIGYGLKFATKSGTDKELPQLTLTGKRLLTEDKYTIAYSDSRGNLIAFNAHGQKVVAQPKEYLTGIKTFTNAAIKDGKLYGNFITQRLDLDYFRTNKLYIPQVYGELMLG